MTRFVEEALAGEADSDVFARLLYKYGVEVKVFWRDGK